MNTTNAEVRKSIEDRRDLFKALRRSDIALQFRQHMVAKGIKNADVALRLNVSEANVSRWLKGNQNLSLDTLYSLADALQEPLELVVGQPSSENSDACLVSISVDRVEWTIADAPESAQIIDLGQYAGLKIARNESKFKPAKSELNIEFEDEAYGRTAIAA